MVIAGLAAGWIMYMKIFGSGYFLRLSFTKVFILVYPLLVACWSRLRMVPLDTGYSISI